MAFMGMGMNAAGGVMGGMQQPAQGTPQAESIQQKPMQNTQEQQPQAEDPYAKLIRLKELLDLGVISQEEFDAAKAKVLEV